MLFLSASHQILTVVSLIAEWDKNLFFLINGEWVNTFNDFLLPILRYPKTWIPLYVLLLLYGLIKFKQKSWSWILFAIICITISDQLSSQVLKGFFDRLRPCQDFPGLVRLLVDRCPGNASFPSSHAVNHFAMGTYFMLSLKPFLKKWSYLFLLWAASICYAQVYVGVHYPLDVTGGAILGILIGWFVAFLLIKYFNPAQLH